MYYFIDGYNLLFTLSSEKDRLQDMRNSLISDLAEKVNALGLEVTLFFDAKYQEDDISRSHIDSLEIIYTAVGETADELIISEVQEHPHPSQITIITRDRELISRTKRLKAHHLTPREFLQWLNSRYKKRNVKKRPVPLPVALPKTKESLKKPESSYLEIFEKMLAHLEKKENAPNKEISEYARWLKIFEERSQPSDEP